MQSTEATFPLIIILGPTAVGKTEASLQLAERLDGEIISADSRLLYRGMDIGTAKPALEERQRVPHHLIDVADPDQVWSLAMYLAAVKSALRNIHERGRLPFMVGGTGQYVRAVVEGWQIPEVQPDPRLRTVLEAWAMEIGPEALYQRLVSIDPEAATRIEPQNLRRTVRALEVVLSTGQLFSTQREVEKPPYDVLMLGLTRPREELYERIDARIQNMFAEGLVEETRILLERGYSPDLPPLSAIGYRQVIQYLKGEIPMDDVVVQMKRITRRFVRHQANWFKEDDPNIEWFQVGTGSIDEMEVKIRNFLRK